MTAYCRMIFCAVCLLPGMLLYAQDAPIELGVVVEAALAAGEAHRYQLRALELTLISFHLEALDPALDPVLEIFDSSGELVIRNDDAAYPDRLDAMIQALIMPRTDVYTVEVSGFGDTSGGYRLLALPGYDTLALRDTAMAPSDWEVVFSDAEITQPSGGRLMPGIRGLSKSASWVGQHFPAERDFYFEVAFDDVSSASNWQVGMLFRYVSPELHYRLLLNKQGYWRIERVDGEAATALRSWRTHPAIAAGETDFRLGVLASGQLFNVVYNGQVVGAAMDDRIEASGGVGITAKTADAFGSRLSFAVTEAIMTLPTRVDGDLLFPQRVVAHNYTAAANLLARQQVIPASGEAKLTLPRSTVRDVPPGVTRLPVASGIAFAEFVIGAEVNYEMRTAANGGCGIIFHYADDENYTLAYVNAAGEYGVSRRQGNAFQPGIYGRHSKPAQNAKRLLVIVYGGMLHYYINSAHVGAMSYQPTAGELGTAVVNFEEVDTTCIFEDLWLWSLDAAS